MQSLSCAAFEVIAARPGWATSPYPHRPAGLTACEYASLLGIAFSSAKIPFGPDVWRVDEALYAAIKKRV
ncbi:hypothetical protein V1291_000354 [Nitrobacteraceae bacterium AZCC 1564]